MSNREQNEALQEINRKLNLLINQQEALRRNQANGFEAIYRVAAFGYLNILWTNVSDWIEKRWPRVKQVFARKKKTEEAPTDAKT